MFLRFVSSGTFFDWNIVMPTAFSKPTISRFICVICITVIFSFNSNADGMSNGHVLKSLCVLRTYTKCAVCKRRLKWPHVKTVKCQSKYLRVIIFFYLFSFLWHKVGKHRDEVIYLSSNLDRTLNKQFLL